MTMRLLPGAVPRESVKELRQQIQALDNIIVAGHTSEQILGAFLRWALDAERMLRNHFDAANVAEQLFTTRYWSLQSPAPASRDLVPLLVESATGEQRRQLGSELERLEHGHALWKQGRLLVPDTSALVHGPELWEWDPAETLDLRDSDVRLIIPMLVIDELDDLKESTKVHSRNRARKSVKWIAEQFGRHQIPVLVHERGKRTTSAGLVRERGS